MRMQYLFDEWAHAVVDSDWRADKVRGDVESTVVAYHRDQMPARVVVKVGEKLRTEGEGSAKEVYETIARQIFIW